MGTSNSEIVGPDFEQGIDANDLADGQILLGHIGDEPVILIRKDKEVFALSAICSHYGAPLHEGCVIESEIRCPWHHAAFDLGTGAAIRAPALDSLKTWPVDLIDNKIYVRASARSQKADAAGSDNRHIVIVGAGAAGYAAADELRKQTYLGRITVLSSEMDLPYDKPNLSKDFLAGSAPEEWISLRPKDYYSEQQIDLELGVQVTSIHPDKKTITCSNGKELVYDFCLLATGATPRKLSVPGADSSQVAYLRTYDDCRALIEKCKDAKNIAIIGSGFIGLEAAASLRARGLSVSVITLEKFPLERIVGKEIGNFFKEVHEENGVTFFFERSVKSIHNGEIILDNDESVPADLVIVGIGVQPNLNLAVQAGIELNRDGIKVSNKLQTSDPSIYAAGDIASWPDNRTGQFRRIEHWAVAQRQGQVAARNILGGKQPFQAVPFFWTQQYDFAMGYVGYAPTWDAITIQGDLTKRDASAAFIRQGEVLAVLTIGRDQIGLMAEKCFEDGNQAALRKLLDL